MDMEIDDSHNVQEESHLHDGRTTTMALPSRCNMKIHVHVGTNVEDPMIEIADATIIEKDQESIEDVRDQSGW